MGEHRTTQRPVGPGFDYDICVVGTGRVGLPLALSFMDTGRRVIGVDRDAAVREAVSDGRMPWKEPGYDELVAQRSLVVHEDMAVAGSARFVIVTVGTPLHWHVESDLGQVQAVLESLAPHLRAGQMLVLRSTVSPGTTAFVGRWLARYTSLAVGRELMLAFCPERIAEGQAREELATLPQVIGADDPTSHAMGAELFAGLAPTVMHTDPVSAELVKLFTNMVRYVNFAVANQLTLVAERFGANIYDIREMANLDYPREHIPKPGLTAGSCLRKDFGMLSEWSAYPDLFLMAWKVNEHMPVFLVERLLERTQVHDRTIALLGWTFKADTDDPRDSLSPKLYRYLSRELPTEVRVSDHHLDASIEDATVGTLKNWDAREAVSGVDVVVVAVAHSGYSDVLSELEALAPGAWVVDLWNASGGGRIVYQVGAPSAP
jgi:UDP-N-acetyl-D-mannosaminuronic acid dehydrogenase